MFRVVRNFHSAIDSIFHSSPSIWSSIVAEVFWILSSLSIRLSTIYLDSYQFVPNDICNGFWAFDSSSVDAQITKMYENEYLPTYMLLSAVILKYKKNMFQ